MGGGNRKVDKVLDCDIVKTEYELQSSNYIYFRKNIIGKGMNPLIVLLLSFYQDGFDIK